MTTTMLRGIGRLFTATARGIVTDAALLVRDGEIAWAGPEGQVPSQEHDDEIDLGGALVTPGLIDCHTHPVYAGRRFAEIAARSEGLSYAQVGAEGGIAATMRATRSVPGRELAAALRDRLAAWLQGGATTVEAKTGYHLQREGELEAVAILHGLRAEPDLPDLYVTFLAAHALPPEYDGDPDGYVNAAASWSADAASAGADGCDVFCDAGYFSVEQSRRILSAGAGAGLTPRIHADELARTGGSRLAAELGCASADHLLKIERADAEELARAGVVATLCPGTALSLGAIPDVQALRDAGTTIALGSDHNPGTCGITSMSLVVSLAVAGLGMSVGEALTAATAGGASSLRLADRGRLEAGRRADLVAWDAEHEGAFAWVWGLRASRLWMRGREATSAA